MSGPGTSGQAKSWCPGFGRDAKAKLGDRLAYVCQHQYFGGSAKKMPDVAAGRARLLDPQILAYYQSTYDSFVTACRQMGLGYRLEETNSVSRGGAEHVNNTLASALWAVHYLHWWADHDCLGINFHTGDWKVTTPGGRDYVAQPLAYAVKAFDLGSHGRRLPVTLGGAAPDLSAYAVLGDDRSVRLTLINSGASATDVSVPAAGRSTGSVVPMTTVNHDLAGEGGLTLGGAPITGQGTWDGHPTPLAAPANGAFAVTVQAASVASVTLAPSCPL